MISSVNRISQVTRSDNTAIRNHVAFDRKIVKASFVSGFLIISFSLLCTRALRICLMTWSLKIQIKMSADNNLELASANA